MPLWLALTSHVCLKALSGDDARIAQSANLLASHI